MRVSLLLLGAAAAEGWGGAAVPKDFDCGSRRLAYDYGKRLLPRLGSFEALFYALGLDKDCGKGLPSGPEALVVPKGRPLAEDAVFVDAEKGRDGNEGSIEKPVASLQEALRKATKTASKEVVLRGGTHYLQETLLVTPEHSDTRVRNYPGEQPVVSGGAEVKASWKPYDVENGKNVYVTKIDLTSAPGLHVGGVRATRARYPNLPGGIEVSPGYGAMIPARKAGWARPKGMGRTEYYEDTAHKRNDTDGFLAYTVGRNGPCSIFDPPVSYWCSKNPTGGGAATFRIPSGITPKEGALPRAPYGNISQMLFFVWHPARWATWMFEVAGHNATTGQYAFGRGGFQDSRGSDHGGDWFVENVMEELDSPGEFFFNESTRELFLWHNGTGPPPDSVVAPQLDVLLNFSGSRWQPVRNVTVEGIAFTASRYTYLHPHGVPSAGDWALERIGALFLEGTEGVEFRSCNFTRLDGHGVFMSGYNRNATVTHSSLEFIGGSAIASWGYTNETEDSGFPYYRRNENFPEAGVDGSDGNHPVGNRVINNLVREVGLYQKQSSFYVQAKTAKSLIAENVMFNGPRAGVNANDGFGGGDEIKGNLVFSTCRESGDHGPFNAWDRQPYVTRTKTGEPSVRMEWREIHGNFFIDNYSPQESVDTDDGAAYYKTHDNFMVYGNFGLKSHVFSHDNRHFNNVYAYIGAAMHDVAGFVKGHEDHFLNNTAVLTGSDVGKSICKEPRTQLGGNRYFTPSGTITECGMALKEAQAQGMDLGSSVAKPPEATEVLAWARQLLGMPAGPEAVLLV